MLLLLSYIDSRAIIKSIEEREMNYYLSSYNSSFNQESVNKEQQRKFLAEQRGDWNSKRKRRKK